jgi:hypothetical protein
MFGMLFASKKFERQVLAPINLAIGSVMHSTAWRERTDTLRSWTIGYLSGFVVYSHSRMIAAEIYSDNELLPNVWNAYRGDLIKLVKLKFLKEDLVDFERLITADISNNSDLKDGYTWGFADAELWELEGKITLVFARKVVDGDAMYTD